MTAVRDLVAALVRARRIVVFSGAGISTDSGIPDYRGTGGQYSVFQPVYYQEFLASEEKRREYWRHKAAVWPAMRDARPAAAHRLASRLAELRWLTGVITQNIDGLHERAGLTPDLIVNLHGSNLEIECIACDFSRPAGEVLDGLVGIQDPDPPRCPTCGELVKPATVMFGQSLDGRILRRAEAMLGNCDLMLVIGSTLTVQPAASIPVAARDNGARLAIVTRGETPLDSIADYRVDGEIAPVAAAALAALEALPEG